MRRAALAVVTALLMTTASAQESTLGLSAIGLCHPRWPCLQSLTVFEGLPVKRLGFLAPPTFGKSCPCYREFLRLPGPKFVRVHIANGTCFPERSRRCGRGEVFEGESIASADRKLRRKRPDLLRRYRRNAVRLRRLLTPDPLTIERLALCLECPVSDRARRALLVVAREVFPEGVFVDSVLTQRCLPGTLCEKHGSHPRLSPPCIADLDGVDAREVDIGKFRARTAQCEASYIWLRELNLLSDIPGPFVPPPQRTNAPTRRVFDLLRRWLSE